MAGRRRATAFHMLVNAGGFIGGSDAAGQMLQTGALRPRCPIAAVHIEKCGLLALPTEAPAGRGNIGSKACASSDRFVERGGKRVHIARSKYLSDPMLAHKIGHGLAVADNNRQPRMQIIK